MYVKVREYVNQIVHCSEQACVLHLKKDRGTEKRNGTK